MLTEWRQIQNNEKAMFGPAYHDLDYVFCLEDGRSYHPERFSRAFLRKQHHYNEAHPEIPLPRLTIHGLRHTGTVVSCVYPGWSDLVRGVMSRVGKDC